jgi:hypothetical protein
MLAAKKHFFLSKSENLTLISNDISFETTIPQRAYWGKTNVFTGGLNEDPPFFGPDSQE